MSAVRKLIFTVVMSLAVLTSSAMPAYLHASPSNANQRIFWVYYRSCSDSPWVCYGGYYKYSEAVQAKNYFEYYGYEVYIR